MELYLTPNGRIDQQTYWRAVLTLFGISAAISVLSAYVTPLIGILSLLFIWPWIAVHVKRFHDSGKTGWLTVPLVLLAMVCFLVLGAVVPGLFGVNTAEMQVEFQREMERVSQDDPGRVFAVMMDGVARMSQAQLVPEIVTTGLVTGILGAVMGLMRTDPNDNAHGPGPGGAASLFE